LVQVLKGCSNIGSIDLGGKSSKNPTCSPEPRAAFHFRLAKSWEAKASEIRKVFLKVISGEFIRTIPYFLIQE
jgi:hypothetical protein